MPRTPCNPKKTNSPATYLRHVIVADFLAKKQLVYWHDKPPLEVLPLSHRQPKYLIRGRVSGYVSFVALLNTIPTRPSPAHHSR